MVPVNGMNTEIRHYVLTPDGAIREFSADEAALIAAGANRVPEFADSDMRYLQVSWEPETEQDLEIQTAGAAIHFDGDGRMVEARPTTEEETISRFEHDTCVQWALRELVLARPTLN